MVNVPGRSKGCATCKRRKIKCDLALPACQKCTRSGLACPGARTEAFFVHATDARQPAELGCTPPSLHASAYDQLFVSYFIEGFGHLKQQRFNVSPANWLDCLPGYMASGTPLVKASIRAASMVSYNAWAGDAAVEKEAYKWYARALGSFRALIAAGDASHDAVCAAVMLMHFETWAATLPEAWTQHVHGATMLLQAAGPAACREGFLYNAFVHLRLQSFIACMHENKVSPFAADEWRIKSNLFDKLVSILLSIQACLYAARSTDRQALRTRIDGLMSELSTWKDTYMPALGPAPPINVPSNADVAAVALGLFFHAASLLALGVSTLCGEYNHIRAVEEHSHAILAGSQVRTTGPLVSRAKIMVLPQLKVVSVWGAPGARDTALRMMQELAIGTFVTMPAGSYFEDLARQRHM